MERFPSGAQKSLATHFFAGIPPVAAPCGMRCSIMPTPIRMALLLKGPALRILLAAIVAAALAAVTILSLDTSCIPPQSGVPRPMRGEVMVRPGAKTLYFDGRCWTTTRQMPTDTAF